MKRIKAACLEQTIHFQLRDNLCHDAAVKAVREEYEQYKKGMERNGTRYVIEKEETLDDGSILIEIKKQYNGHACGSYMS